MTVMFPPLVRLKRTRIAVTTQLRSDVHAWQKSLASAVVQGAGTVIVCDPAFAAGNEEKASESRLRAGGILMGAALTSARQAGPNALVGVAEPVSHDVLTDIVFLESLDHLSLWNDTVLTGIEARTPDEVDTVLASNLVYLVVDWRVESLVAYTAQSIQAIKESKPDLVWFVKGMASLDEVEQAVDLGARRVWLDEDVPGYESIGVWSTYLRGVWRADPDMRHTIPTRFSTRKLL